MFLLGSKLCFEFNKLEVLLSIKILFINFEFELVLEFSNFNS